MIQDHAEILAWKMSLAGPARVVYEAWPTGFGLARFLLAARIECVVAAPSKLQRPAGDRIKTDALEAASALLYLGEVTSVTVPSMKQEAARDLVRACTGIGPGWPGVIFRSGSARGRRYGRGTMLPLSPGCASPELRRTRYRLPRRPNPRRSPHLDRRLVRPVLGPEQLHEDRRRAGHDGVEVDWQPDDLGLIPAPVQQCQHAEAESVRLEGGMRLART